MDFTSLPKDLYLNPSLEVQSTYIFVGDLMGIGHKEPYLGNNLKDFIKGSDYFVANLECLINEKSQLNLIYQVSSEKCISKLKSYLPNTKFLFSVANNHSLDEGIKGLHSTIEKLEALDISAFGTQDQPSLENIYSATQWCRGNSVLRTLDDKVADTKIGFYHWGREFYRFIDKDLIHFVNQTPHDIILGHHPHIIHTPCFVEGKYLFSSLGNFWVSYGGRRVNRGLVVKVLMSGDEMVSIHWQKIKTTSSSSSVTVEIES